MSIDSFNKYMDRVQVVPLTSNISRLYSSEAYVTVGNKTGKAMAHQLATVSKERILSYYGNISTEDMTAVEQAIMIQLGFLHIE